MKNNIKAFDITKEATLIKAKLPELPKRPRKNLFDILKIQHREIRNSNILAYFFDPNEDHGFGSLFYDALQEIAIKRIKVLKNTHPNISFNDISTFDEVTKVNTEEQTKGAKTKTKTKTKSIDIVLEGDDWIIGIENKIHHHLANPLNTYWAHLKSKNKIPFGILLTLFPYGIEKGKLKDGNYFLNITHRDLLEGVQQNIQLTGESSDTDIFYLREYFKNIESHYYHLKHNPMMNTIVQEITENYSAINEILKKKEAAENHIENQLNSIFSEYGYVKARKWFRREDKLFDLYFYISPAADLMSKNAFRLCFEIRNQTNHNTEMSDFREYFRNKFADLDNFEQDDLVTGNQRTHAFIYKEDNFFEKDKPFGEKMKNVLKLLIGADNSPVKQIEQYLIERNCFFTG
ncbi:PD-(D/E)XK nuclease family protein [Psychroserpens burtonensis]|nr:PD-(D/E)XK nuclease family protein [Psychroserpens burtonensis]